MMIRAYEGRDAGAVAGVVAAAHPGDPGLGEAASGLYGEGRDGPLWRRSLVAVDPDGGAVVGVAGAALSQRHPGSAPVGVAVRPGSRRQGVGSALLAAVREEIAQFRPPPLWSMVDSRDPAGVGFAAAHGFRTVLRYGIWRLDPAVVDLPEQPSPVPLTRVADLTEEQRVDAFAALDQWANSALAEPTPREVIRTDVLPRLLPDGGAVALAGGRPVAVGMLGDFEGALTALCGAEPDLPAGVTAALLARLLAAAGGRPVEVEVSMDGGALAVLVADLAGAEQRCDRLVLGEGKP